MGRRELTAAISTLGLTKRYGSVTALDGMDLEVHAGSVFGYLGPNGAGKTTTIRLLVGLLKPSAGSGSILGHDTWAERELVHATVGYLPGEFVAYDSLTGEQYLSYLAHLRGTVSWSEVDLLAKRFDLDLSRPIRTLSHGNRQKVGLVQAFMHGPRVLVLDEPTSGLDPIMQREFLNLIKEVREAGRTVFMSSHVLDEVEAVADTVGILRRGELLVVEQVEALKAMAVRRIDLMFDREPRVEDLQGVPGVREVWATDHSVRVVVEGTTCHLFDAAAPYGISNVVTHEADLGEIFLAYYAEDE